MINQMISYKCQEFVSKELVHKFNDTMAEFPKNKTLNHVFEEQVLKTPNHIAVIFEEEQLTYKQLNEKALS